METKKILLFHLLGSRGPVEVGSLVTSIPQSQQNGVSNRLDYSSPLQTGSIQQVGGSGDQPD